MSWMIVLVTDFGFSGPYTGQVKAVLCREAPTCPVIDLFADAPMRDPQAAAYLLSAYVEIFPQGTVFLCVVDPGVGSARLPVVVRAGGRWFVGPDNGLLELVMRRAQCCHIDAWQIEPSGAAVSATFHGRDVFAPAAARIACGRGVPGRSVPPALLRRPKWPDDLPQVVYIDVYGNAISGVRAAALPVSACVSVGGRRLSRARTFDEVPPGEPFWYENANGLMEVAVNRGRADELLCLAVGTTIDVER